MKIKTFILKTFGLKPEESAKFFLLFFHSFFLGLFVAFYFAPANSVFIQHFGSEQMPVAYIAAGIAGYLITLIYSKLQKRVNSRTLFLTALLFMFFIPLISRIGLIYSPEKWLSFFVFIWGWPFISLVAIESGGMAIRFLNLRQVKRLFGLVNMGGVIASILGYLTIPLLQRLFSHSYDLFYVGAVGVALSIVLLLIIYKRFTTAKTGNDEKLAPKTQSGFMKLIKEKYFLLIFLSATLSMLVIYFSDFTFLAGIKAQPHRLSTPEAVGNFIAIVFGALKIGELLLSALSSRILSRHGLNLGLSVMPFVLALLMLGALVSGLTIGAGSLLFFAFIVLNKSFERILRRGLDDPSFNVLYQPLPDEQKLTIQTRVGVIMQLSIAIAGGFLFIATKLLVTQQGTFNLRYFPLLFFPILVVWFFVTRRLYKSYKEKLREILAEKNRLKSKDVHKDIYGTDLLTKQLESDRTEAKKLSVNILAETNPHVLEPYAADLLKTRHATIVKAILQSIEPTWTPELKPAIEKIAQNNNFSKEIKQLAQQATKALDFSQSQKLSTTEIRNMANAPETAQKLEVIKFLVKKQQTEPAILQNLLKDKDKTIRQAAIRLAPKNASPQNKKQLLRLLNSLRYHHLSGNALIKIGNSTLPELKKLFDHSDNFAVLLKITEIYARIGTPEAQAFLLDEIKHPEREVQIAIIKALYFSHFQAKGEQTTRVKEKIRDIVKNILWLFVCINDIQAEKNTLKVVQALELERNTKFDLLFYLLSFIYQPATVDLIKTNIIGENIIYALEIVDNFVEQDIKLLVNPLFDKISVNQRMRKLRHYFPMKKLKFTERLKTLISAEEDEIDLWSRTKAIELLGRLHKREKTTDSDEQFEQEKPINHENTDKEMAVLDNIAKTQIPEDIFQSLHHPDELVYSTAAKIIFDENPTVCFDYLETLEKKKQELIEVLDRGKSDLLNERVKYIKRVPDFFGFPENTLVKLAKLFKTSLVKKGEDLTIASNDETEHIFIVVKGRLAYTASSGEKYIFSRNDTILRGYNIEPKADKVAAASNTLILKGNRFEYFNLLVDETEIIQYLFAKRRSRR